MFQSVKLSTKALVAAYTAWQGLGLMLVFAGGSLFGNNPGVSIPFASTWGMKKIARNVVFSLIRAFSPTAMTRAMTLTRTVDTSANRNVNR